MRFPNDMIQRYISEMISHLFTNYQTTHSTHIPNPFIIDDKLLYTMIQNYGQHLSPYPFDGYYVQRPEAVRALRRARRKRRTSLS